MGMRGCLPLFLQRIVFLIISRKIQCLDFCGDPLAGIIPEPEAAVSYGLYPFFGTQNRSVLKLDTMGAVGAGALNFFTKQHELDSSH